MQRTVLQLIDSFQQGGTERQAVQLARLLAESRHFRVHVACLNREGSLRAEVEQFIQGAEIPEYRLNSFYDRNAITQARRLASYLGEHEIEIIHTHDFYTNIFGMAAARLAGTPARVASRRETLGMRSPGQKWAERRAYNLAHAVVANAEAVRAQLIDEGVRSDKISVVYNGLDLKRLTPPANLRRDDVLSLLGLPRDSRRFVTIVANLRHAVKDHPTFLRAARRVRERLADAAFVIAGEGELLEEMRALAASLGLERDTFFIGRCAHIAELLSVSEVCILSSKAEGFSNSILEYMAAARPVVATDVGGAREAIIEGETGYVVPPGDDEMMAARIISLLADRERAGQMGERGRHVVEQKFSCEAQLQRTESLYEELLAARHVARTRVEEVRHESTG